MGVGKNKSPEVGNLPGPSTDEGSEVPHHRTDPVGPLFLVGSPVPLLRRVLGLVLLLDQSFEVGETLLDLFAGEHRDGNISVRYIPVAWREGPSP